MNVLNEFTDITQSDNIGLNFILNELLVHTPYGFELKNNIKRYTEENTDLLIKELNDLESLINKIKIYSKEINDIEFCLDRFKNIKEIIKKLQTKRILDEVELFEIKNFSLIMEDLIELFEKLDFNVEKIDFKSTIPLLKFLDPDGQKISTFYICESYSKELALIRERKRNIDEKFAKEKDEKTRELLKKEREFVVIDENKEELQVRGVLSDKLRENISILEDNVVSIGNLDFMLAKANLSIKFGGIKPGITIFRELITKEPITKEPISIEILLEDAFNPYIQSILSKTDKSFTPISISLKSGVTIITGANMGGKTTALNLIALNVYLAQIGFFVFAKSAKIPVIQFMHIISSDLQDIKSGLSSFGAEILKINDILQNIDNKKGIILLDEFARTTNPTEGTILVKAISEYCNTLSGILTVIATHYDGIPAEKMVHYQVKGLKNVDLEELRSKINVSRKNSVEIIQDYIDYRLEQVPFHSKVPKDALNIAILLGLKQDVIDFAKNVIKAKERLKESD